MRIDYFPFYHHLLAMFARPLVFSKALPNDCRHAAEKLFPSAGFPEGKGPSLEAAAAFAHTLGIAEDYRKLWEVRNSGPALGDFLVHFQNNLDLLIQKTWVEKAEETRKDELLDKIPPFITLIEKAEYREALGEFGSILEELAYLFFGAQSLKDDFAEYVLRIDTKMGLFWWYGGQINAEQKWVKNADKSVLYSLLLLGICYLTDF